MLYFNKLLSKYLTLLQTSFCTSKGKIFDSVQAHKDYNYEFTCLMNCCSPYVTICISKAHNGFKISDSVIHVTQQNKTKKPQSNVNHRSYLAHKSKTSF